MHPNPVTTQAVIRSALPHATHVRLAVYDVLGREVARLADGEFSAGEHEVRVDASGLPPGLYSYRIVAGDLRASRTMVRVR